MESALTAYRFIPVVALLGLAAFLLTDRSKPPLALRGLKKMRDEYVEEVHEKEPEQKPAVTPSEKKEGKNRKR